MPFLAHLEELRKRLIISFSVIGVAFILAFNVREYCIRLLQWPLTTDIVMGRKFPFLAFNDKPAIAKLTALGPAETLWTHFKVAFIVGAMLALPVILYEIWKFIEPGLLPKEKRFALPFVILSTISFFIGVAFCFLIVLPMAMQFLLTFDPSIQQMPRFGEYVDFTLKFLLAFGVIFELPVGITIAARLGMVTPQFLARQPEVRDPDQFRRGGHSHPDPGRLQPGADGPADVRAVRSRHPGGPPRHPPSQARRGGLISLLPAASKLSVVPGLRRMPCLGSCAAPRSGGQ